MVYFFIQPLVYSFRSCTLEKKVHPLDSEGFIYEGGGVSKGRLSSPKRAFHGVFSACFWGHCSAHQEERQKCGLYRATVCFTGPCAHWRLFTYWESKWVEQMATRHLVVLFPYAPQGSCIQFLQKACPIARRKKPGACSRLGKAGWDFAVVTDSSI